MTKYLKENFWVIAAILIFFFVLVYDTGDKRIPVVQNKSVCESVSVEPVIAEPPALESRQKTYTLVRVVDGDTFIAADGSKNEIKVRMAGIDAPEAKQVFGSDAATYLTIGLHNPFTLKLWGKDRYGREIATVYTDGEDLNREMVYNGFAWAYDEYKHGESYSDIQNESRREGRGLWANKSTLPPWFFRKIYGHGDYGLSLLRGGFYLWDGIIHNRNCADKIDAKHLWNGVDPYTNCQKCGGLVYD